MPLLHAMANKYNVCPGGKYATRLLYNVRDSLTNLLRASMYCFEALMVHKCKTRLECPVYKRATWSYSN